MELSCFETVLPRHAELIKLLHGLSKVPLVLSKANSDKSNNDKSSTSVVMIDRIAFLGSGKILVQDSEQQDILRSIVYR